VIVGTAAMKTGSISMSQYGTIMMTEVYEQRGLTKQDAENHLSTLNLFANVLALVSVLFFGYLSRVVALSKLLVFISVLILSFYSLLLYDILNEPLLTSHYDSGLVGATALLGVLFML
jgi:hypothetical protein